MIVLMTKQEHKLFRVGAAAHELGLHPMTVRRWIKAGRIQVVQVGREMRVPRSEIERMVGTFDSRLLVLSVTAAPQAGLRGQGGRNCHHL